MQNRLTKNGAKAYTWWLLHESEKRYYGYDHQGLKFRRDSHHIHKATVSLFKNVGTIYNRAKLTFTILQ
jgi:hypothetical protein